MSILSEKWIEGRSSVFMEKVVVYLKRKMYMSFFQYLCSEKSEIEFKSENLRNDFIIEIRNTKPEIKIQIQK